MLQAGIDISSAAAARRIAVLIPCLNEVAAISQVVGDFQRTLPGATIHVYDNGSTDATRDVARAAGAIVRTEARRGKGNVVRRMFGDVDADVYVLVDGDATYDASAAATMIKRLETEQLDMVIGCRMTAAEAAYRPGHRLGNRLLTAFLARLFGDEFSDILSGYRVFSRRYVKSFPSLSCGFEIETEMSVHALALRLPSAEVPTRYDARCEGSASKLSTYRDGWRILRTMLDLFRKERPQAFFGLIATALVLLSVWLAIPLALTYLDTGLVPRFPTAILCTGLMVLAMLSLACGLILDTVTHGRREIRRLAYLACRASAEWTC